ncbi:hypothetical protein [Roseofilum casamattae]|uniref:Uncharacterized protein n=1 Tax=Roseofilum casamattae BLCC-M143 TaxID=3022442 RepID=A0ABT7BVZ1_9CYAN|nr:hypothetical protein [Roseofilum casamattae]MDJ1183356.1 hypothetical protein [Roseofilum casamattae BLCC-M143]
MAKPLNILRQPTNALLLGAVAGLMTLATAVAPAVAQTKIAQLRNYCNNGESLYLSAETQNFWVNICGGDAPYTYVGVDKSTGDSIRLNLHGYEPDGSFFEAWNGNYSYIISFGDRGDHYLVVSQGDTTILEERLINWE